MDYNILFVHCISSLTFYRTACIIYGCSWREVMPRYENYFVVEFRFPVMVEDVSTVAEAISKANRICERVHGFKPKNWFARIFEYSTREKSPGLAKEYFYNPNSSTYREITKNIKFFTELDAKGISVDDVFDYESYIGKVAIDEEVKVVLKQDEQES